MAVFDLKKQRDTLEQLRREVQALDEVTERGLPLSFASEATEKSSPIPTRRTLTEKTEASRLDEHLEANITELEEQLGSLGSECEVARATVSQRESLQAQAKAAWSRALSHAAAAEGREERRWCTAKKEYEEMHNQELQVEAAYRIDRDRLRQRHRNLRMQLRQAEQQHAQSAREEAMGCEYRQDRDTVGYNSAEDVNICPAAASTAVPRSCSASRDRARSSSPRTSRQGVTAKLMLARRDLDAAHETIMQLQQRQDALLQGKDDLSERQHGLRKASRLSDREVENLRRRSELRHEEASLREEQVALRKELKEVGSEVEVAQREAVRQRRAQECVAQELSDREMQFREQESSAVQALDTIQEYLCSNGGLSTEERQAHLADWLESDISTRQVERVKRRLSEIVADAGARAQVLEQAVSELHADLDRRAAIILELVERRNACIGDDRVADSKNTGKAGIDSLGVVGYGTSSDEEEPHTNASSVADEQHPHGKLPHNGDQKMNGQLDRRALEDELEHQRGLFELRGEQVQGLEQRLAALLAREAPRVYALRAWVAVHDALSRDRLQGCLRAAASNNALRADVEAMHRDKSLHLAEAEAEFCAQKYHLSEAVNGARLHADEAAACAAGIQKRRQGLLKGLDRLLKAEAKLTSRVSTASEAVDRDQRRLIDLTARQIRASSAMARQREQIGVKFDRTLRNEAARQALTDARDLVESTREQQAEALLGLVQESIHVTAELRRVDEALEQAIAKEERATAEIAELEDEGASSEAVGMDAPRRRHGVTNSPTRDASKGVASSSRRGTSSARSQLERKKIRLEDDFNSTIEQLRRGELKFEEMEKHQKELEDKSEMKIAELQEEFENEKARQRASVASLLKRYRSTQASSSEAEHHLGELCARSDVLSKELADARLALKRDRERRQKRQQSDTKRTPGVGVTALNTNGMSEPAKGRPIGTFRNGEQEMKTGKSPRGTKKDTLGPTHAMSRAIPSVLEIRQRKDLEGQAELHSFYLQVFPLLKGTNLEVFRKSRQRFETRQLVLSSDLQRFELWPPSTSSTASPSVTSPSPGASGQCSGSSTPTPPASRGRPRLPESFIRVEGIARVHVPKTTLAAVQRAILSATHSGMEYQGANEPCLKDGGLLNEDHAAVSRMLQKDGARTTEDGSHNTGYAQRDHDVSSSGEVVGGSVGCPGTGGVVNYQAFPFEVVMTSADPWRFMAADVHTFHLATAALSAILTSRASLQSFAVALSLGGTSQLQVIS